MIAPCTGGGKTLIPANNTEKTGANAGGSITNSLKEP